MIKISYDAIGDVLEIKFSEKPIKDSEYIEESGIVIDYDENNNLVAVEIISYSNKVPRKELADVLAISG
ncbi:MAG TPA: DUF2283 domain-containing protein [Candidatus Marinimicrobia bacterium]|nr:DUF2283 domain-containing protein [Candidatus Neomarinimicrobiota bacterium]HRS51764.1 DUF2283 domain-containing protein [Candidatus Neomarinimicrobiota bacterium]